MYKNRKDLYKKAKKLAEEKDNYSISYLQRKLEIGYNTARNLINKIQKKS